MNNEGTRIMEPEDLARKCIHLARSRMFCLTADETLPDDVIRIVLEEIQDFGFLDLESANQLKAALKEWENP